MDSVNIQVGQALRMLLTPREHLEGSVDVTKTLKVQVHDLEGARRLFLPRLVPSPVPVA